MNLAKSLALGAFKYMLLGVMIAGLVMYLRSRSHAPTTQEFAECDGEKGVALELCKAAMEVGCFENHDDPPACEDLASTYLAITGEQPKWVTSP